MLGVRIIIRKTTKEILAESFVELAETRTIDKISIIDIVENCSLTKPTFYRYFKDKYDLIQWIYAQNVEKIFIRIGKNGYIFKNSLLDNLHYFESNRKFMVNILKHTSGRDSFLNLINEIDIRFITEIIRKESGYVKLPEDVIAMIRVYCYGKGQYLSDWLLDCKPVSCEKMAEYMEACIPDILRLYLCE